MGGKRYQIAKHGFRDLFGQIVRTSQLGGELLERDGHLRRGFDRTSILRMRGSLLSGSSNLLRPRILRWGRGLGGRNSFFGAVPAVAAGAAVLAVAALFAGGMMMSLA